MRSQLERRPPRRAEGEGRTRRPPSFVTSSQASRLPTTPRVPHSCSSRCAPPSSGLLDQSVEFGSLRAIGSRWALIAAASRSYDPSCSHAGASTRIVAVSAMVVGTIRCVRLPDEGCDP